MSAVSTPIIDSPPAAGEPVTDAAPPDRVWRRLWGSGRVVVGGGVLLAILLLSVVTMAWTLKPSSSMHYDQQNPDFVRRGPELSHVALWFGGDHLGRSVLGRCLLGGVISLSIGIAAAALSIFLGVTVGLISGYRGGWTDELLMRIVDVLYGLPYILLVILFKTAFEPRLAKHIGSSAANLIILFSAIGLVSWLTMARVVRGQVLSLRSLPFIEAARASGLTERRIFARHILPNLAGPILVYATLTIPQAILQESFLSFLGVGIAPPMPTWGGAASEGLLPALNPIASCWWMLLFPCTLLAITLLCLNFLGDGLRDVFDPKREAAKI
jgi:oligopeptide transport system permease protein